LQWAEDRILDENLPGRHDEAAPLSLGDFDLMREFEPGPTLDALKACASERSITAGESIFRTGDPADELFLVRRGVVRVTLPLNSHGYHTLANFGRGHYFGEMGFLAHGTRSANATATTNVDLYAISRARFDTLSHSDPIIGVKVFARLATTLALRLRRADAELRTYYDT
jgi:SulP family sulfate permease